MTDTPDTTEIQARFNDMEATYKELLATANSTTANLNVLLKAAQRELQVAQVKIKDLEAEVAKATEPELNGLDPPKTNGHDAAAVVN